MTHRLLGLYFEYQINEKLKITLLIINEPTSRSLDWVTVMGQFGETKKKVLEAAFNIFSERGYNRTPISAIVKESGVSKGGIFHHFESKYHLARDCLFWWAENHISTRISNIERGKLKPDDILIHFIDSMLEMFDGSKGFTKFFWEVFEEALTNKEDNSIWLEFLDGYVKEIEQIYESMGVKDPKMKSVCFLSNLDGLALYYSMLNESPLKMDQQRIRNELIRTWVNIS